MPPLPVITNTFRCALHWSDGGGQQATNVIHIRHPAGVISNDAVFDALDDNVTADMWGSIGAGVSVVEVVVTPLDGSTASTAYTATGAQWGVGRGIGQFLPAGACLVSLRTLLRGRSNRGRVYVPFLSESANINGGIDPTYVAVIQPAWDAFRAALIANDFPMELVVASYKLSTAESVVVSQVESVAATQRRRQGRLRSA